MPHVTHDVTAGQSDQKRSGLPATAPRAQQRSGGPRETEFKYLDLQRKERGGILAGLWRALHRNPVSSVAIRNQRSCIETGTIRCFALLCDLSHACPSLGLNYASSYSAWAPKTVGWLRAAKRKICLSLFLNSRTAGTVPFLCPSATGPFGSFQSPIAFLLSQLKGCQIPRDFYPLLPYPMDLEVRTVQACCTPFGGQPCLFPAPAVTPK